MDILQLYDDFNIPYATEGKKHTTNGWINTPCPYCADNGSGLHLGWNIQEEFFHCWKCGFHPPVQTIATLINVSLPETYAIIKRYGNTYTIPKNTVKKAGKPLILPNGVTPLTLLHKKYLEKRGFDANMLEQKYGLQSTGPFSKVDESWYKHRILLPYVWNGEMVTWDTRDVTGKAEDKYKACPKNREVMERKKILYGMQEAWITGVGICVEGPTDVWRFGEMSFATSGIQFTTAQVRVMSQIFKHIFICYDSRSATSKELQAQQQARHLKSELRMRNVNAEIVRLPFGDPGGTPQREADKFVNNLLR